MRASAWIFGRVLRTGFVAALALAAGLCQAASSRYCDPPGRLSAEQQDKLFRLAAVIKTELEGSGARLALIARSGLDLARFDQRYSHAGISLKANPESAWAVRQLYYSCDEQLPRLFDQGISAFLLGTDQPGLGYVSVLLLPPAESQRLERTALDRSQALQLLGATYSANAYAFSQRYQNCNQWVAELIASAWGETGGGTQPRAEAQRWLQVQGYAPTVIDVGWRALMWAGALIPWIHSDDHPGEDLAALRYRVSMPASIEAFVRQHVAGAKRIEFCHDSRRIVVRRGWTPIAEGCVPGEGDTVVALD